ASSIKITKIPLSTRLGQQDFHNSVLELVWIIVVNYEQLYTVQDPYELTLNEEDLIYSSRTLYVQWSTETTK
ncbi:28770_t:CDS:2, partial [Dentiscutata erythropus]